MPTRRENKTEKDVGDDQYITAKTMNKKILFSNSEPFIPHEIYFEILGWLTVADLLRCKCVCKKWFAMIQDRKFIEMHMKRAGRRYLHKSEDGTRGSNEIDQTFEILYHFDGLLVELGCSSQELRIRNPATRRILDLPYPNQEPSQLFISYLPCTGSYKVVSVYDGELEGQKSGCEVLDIGSGNLLWKPLEIFNYHEQDRMQEKIEVRMVGGIFHFTRFVEDGLGEFEIVSMDLDNEVFTCCKVPKRLLSNCQRLMSWNQNLSLASIVDEELHVWVLEDYKKQKWADRKIVIPLPFLKKDPNMKECLDPCSVEGGIVWFCVNYVKLVGYDFKSLKVADVICAPEGEKLVCAYHPSLVTLKGMQAEEKEHAHKVEQSS